MTSIYVLIDPRTHKVRYVGKTRASIESRVYGHMYAARHHLRDTYCCKWLRQLIAEDLEPLVVVVDEVPDNIWREAETEWINFYHRLGAKLTNLQHGGVGPDGPRISRGPCSDELKEKLRIAMTGKVCPPDRRAKISASLRGRPLAESTKRKMAESHRRRLAAG